MVSALYLIVDNHGKPTLLGYSGEWPQVFLNQQTLYGVAKTPRIGEGAGFDSQDSVTFILQILLSQLVLNPLGHYHVK